MKANQANAKNWYHPKTEFPKQKSLAFGFSKDFSTLKLAYRFLSKNLRFLFIFINDKQKSQSFFESFL
jgi:hypothetical protein